MTATGADSGRHRVCGHMDVLRSKRMALPLACTPRRRFLESFSIKDADMECKVPFIVAITWSFDVLGVVLAFTTTLLVGDTLFVVVTVIGPINRRRWVRDAH